jgi:UDP-N-acetyl-D-glucosamine dehydrogenase
MKTEILRKTQDKSLIIGIVGLGYVGLPLALRYSHMGFKVLGFDIDPEKIEAIKSGRSYIEHIPAETIHTAYKKNFIPTNDFTLAREADALILCVPTPLNKFREPDLSYVLGTMDTLAPFLRPGHIVSLESTTYPGTTEEELRPRIEKQNLEIGKTAFLVFSPEREDPGRIDFNTQTIPKVVGGSTPDCLEVGKALYQAVIDRVVPVSSTQAAEMTKLLENIHRAVNIGLVNELKIVCDKMGVDIFEVVDAAATKPFGFVPYYPGPGIGGHCIPIDPFYLTWKAREFGVHTRFIELAGEINASMPHYVIAKLVKALNEKQLSLKGSKVLVLGLAYKKNVDDVRESPSVELMEDLRREGALVEYSDPHVSQFKKMRKHDFQLKSVALNAESLKQFDVVLLATDHDKFDYDLIKKHSKLIVDTRGRYRGVHSHIVKA